MNMDFRNNRPQVPQSQPPSTIPNLQSSNFNFQDDSLLDADDSADFQLRNQNFGLKSRINQLQQENIKMQMQYEGRIKQLKQKCMALERQTREKVDTGKANNQLQNRVEYLMEENQQLKRELSSIADKNRVTPNFNSPQFAQDLSTLHACLQRPEGFSQFQKAYDSAAQFQFTTIKGQMSTLEKQNKKLKQKIEVGEREQKERKQANEKWIKTLQVKDEEIQELKTEHRMLNLQLNDSKKVINQLTSSQGDIGQYQRNIKTLTNQVREKQVIIVELEENMNRMEKEHNRLKNQKSSLQQELKGYQNQRKDSEGRKKQLQDQSYKLQYELSEAKLALSTQKADKKKIINSLKLELTQQLTNLRTKYEQKGQQNSKLRDALMALSEQNQKLKDKDASYTNAVDKTNQEIGFLNASIDKLIEQLRVCKEQMEAKEKQHQKNSEGAQRELAELKKEVHTNRDQSRKSSVVIEQTEKEHSRVQEDLKHKEELIQIMRIQTEEAVGKQKQFQTRIKEIENRMGEKQKIIRKLQSDIQDLNFDNKQLQIANDELRQKVQTLTKIRFDVETMNTHLKKEKMLLDNKRKGEEIKTNMEKIDSPPKGLPIERRESRNSGWFSTVKQLNDVLQAPDQLLRLGSGGSEEGNDMLFQVIKQLKVQRTDMQQKINQMQGELGRKSVQLSIKQGEVKTLKQDRFKQQQLNFQPLIETTKRTQFNAIFFQNKIAQMQNEVKSVRSMKEKQLQEQKKVIRKQLQDKFMGELRRQQAYIHQLQKNINNKTSRKDQSKQIVQELKGRIQQLEAQNYNANLQLSTSFQEQNRLLLKCKQMEQKHKQGARQSQRNQQSLEDYMHLKQSYQLISSDYNYQKTMLQNANQQIVRLNDILMIKQSQLKSVSGRNSQLGSPNASFLSHQSGERQQNNRYDVNKSVDVDLLKVWAQKKTMPGYSRI